MAFSHKAVPFFRGKQPKLRAVVGGVIVAVEIGLFPAVFHSRRIHLHKQENSIPSGFFGRNVRSRPKAKTGNCFVHLLDKDRQALLF